MRPNRGVKILLALALVATMGCSIFKKKQDGPSPAETKAPETNLTTTNVFDAGTYSDKEDISDLKMRGGKLFETLPAEKLYSVDREKVAPLGKLIYVVTTEDTPRCIPAKYTMLDNKKKLVVYSKTTVPNTYCIYQKVPTSEPTGFAVSMFDGGMCKPAIIQTKVDEQKKTISSIEFFDKIVSMKFCFEGTVSYGLGKAGR